MVGEVIEAQLALGEKKILHRLALIGYLFFRGGYELLHLAPFGGVLNIIGINFWVQFFVIRGVVAVFVDENRSSVVVEGFPEKGFGCEAEDEKVAWRGAFPKHVGDGFEV